MNKMKPEKYYDNAGTIREGAPLRHHASAIRHPLFPAPPSPSAIIDSPLAEGPAIRHLLDFEDMQVWQDAQDLAVAVYEDMRIVKDFSFVDQIKRAAVSISNNIAEGAERVTPSEFARFLDIAKGSDGEVRSMYRLACRLKFVNSDIAGSRCEACKSISRQLGGFAKHLRARRSSE